MKFIDLTGQQFGQLTVTALATKAGGRPRWDCRCSCGGQRKAVPAYHLRGGLTVSCGCSRGTHRQTGTRLYQTWRDIKQRCLNPRNASYPDYGGRGIHLHPTWATFSAFQDWALQAGYTDDLTIERHDVDGGYVPDNCSWIPRNAQQRNRRDTRWVELNGQTYCLKEACRRLGLVYCTTRVRLAAGGSWAEIAAARVKLGLDKGGPA